MVQREDALLGQNKPQLWWTMTHVVLAANKYSTSLPLFATKIKIVLRLNSFVNYVLLTRFFLQPNLVD